MRSNLFHDEEEVYLCLKSVSCVQRAPRRLRHGPTPLRHSIIPTGTEWHVIYAAPTSRTAIQSSWRNSQRVYAGPRPLRERTHRALPFLSFWEAHRREQAAFQRGDLPSYSQYLAAPAMSPIHESTPLQSEKNPFPFHHCTNCPKIFKSSFLSFHRPHDHLSYRAVDHEAGLRLRHIRIASACTLLPQLAATMQALLNMEIRAAMQREEMQLLARFQENPASGAASNDRCPPRGFKRRRRSENQINPEALAHFQKKLRIAATTMSRPVPYVLQTQEELVATQPEQSNPNASLFLDEDDIMERAWTDSMLRRLPAVNLRKSVLIDGLLKDVRSAECPETRAEIQHVMGPVMQRRAWRANLLAWRREQGSFEIDAHQAPYSRLSSSWWPYRGHFPVISIERQLSDKD